MRNLQALFHVQAVKRTNSTTGSDMNKRLILTTALALGVGMSAFAAQEATLKHRYSFEPPYGDGYTATDSVGGAHSALAEMPTWQNTLMMRHGKPLEAWPSSPVRESPLPWIKALSFRCRLISSALSALSR